MSVSIRLAGDADVDFLVELVGPRAGAMAWELTNRRSGIVHVSGLAVHPRFRGRRLADEAARLFQRHLIHERGFHRIELEVYGFNERAQRHAERSGFVTIRDEDENVYSLRTDPPQTGDLLTAYLGGSRSSATSP